MIMNKHFSNSSLDTLDSVCLIDEVRVGRKVLQQQAAGGFRVTKSDAVYETCGRALKKSPI